MLGKVIVNDEAGVCGFAYRGAMAALGRRVSNYAKYPQAHRRAVTAM